MKRFCDCCPNRRYHINSGKTKEKRDARMNATTALVGMSIEEMERWAEENGQPAYRGRQLYQWIYRRGAAAFSEMTNLPKAWRSELEKSASLTALKVAAERVSSDGTTKYLMELQDGEQVESVLIPDGSRLTLCVFKSRSGAVKNVRSARPLFWGCGAI